MIDRILQILSVVFPIALCAILLLLTLEVGSLGEKVDRAGERLALPAGIYICDGERCVIANDIEGMRDIK